MSRRSLRSAIARAAGLALLAAAVAATGVATFAPSPWIVGAATLCVGLGAAWLLLGHVLGALSGTLRALADGVRSFRDSDFSMRLGGAREDELGELVTLYNEMGDALRAERYDLYQRELLLDTVLQGAPMAIVLTGPTGRVVYSNRAARDLLGGGRRLDGEAWSEVLAACSRELAEALATPGDALFTIGGNEPGREETFRASNRGFQLHLRPHSLIVIERLTPELRRHEVEVWKKAIRIINHELNNSLAPIRSLLHSARVVSTRPDQGGRLASIFDTLEERTGHLVSFLEGYARFARLPKPRKEEVRWPEFLASVQELVPFRIDGTVPSQPAVFDPTQVQQVLINLVKNATEAGGPADEVAVSVHAAADGGSVLRVYDRGRGMDGEMLKQAVLPFYSSKPAGSGLGLPLCQEIVEAHGGRLRLQSREGGGTVVTCWLP